MTEGIAKLQGELSRAMLTSRREFLEIRYRGDCCGRAARVEAGMRDAFEAKRCKQRGIRFLLERPKSILAGLYKSTAVSVRKQRASLQARWVGRAKVDQARDKPWTRTQARFERIIAAGAQRLAFVSLSIIHIELTRLPGNCTHRGVVSVFRELSRYSNLGKGDHWAGTRRDVCLAAHRVISTTIMEDDGFTTVRRSGRGRGNRSPRAPLDHKTSSTISYTNQTTSRPRDRQPTTEQKLEKVLAILETRRRQLLEEEGNSGKGKDRSFVASWTGKQLNNFKCSNADCTCDDP